MAFIVFGFTTGVIAEEILGYDITVVVKNQHPFLTDHQRELVILKNGAIITRTPLRFDPGSRVPLNIFRAGDRIVLIDCNGDHYELNLSDGAFRKVGWFWEKALPAGYIGTFRLRKGGVVEFQKEPLINIRSVYVFKDP
jgi:hypothetical protein